jgi:hypothetical protein
MRYYQGDHPSWIYSWAVFDFKVLSWNCFNAFQDATLSLIRNLVLFLSIFLKTAGDHKEFAIRPIRFKSIRACVGFKDEYLIGERIRREIASSLSPQCIAYCSG